MKRKTILILCAVLTALMLLLSACKDGDKDDDTSSALTVTVDGMSMEPTFKDGQQVDLLPLSGMPAQGDVICFRRGSDYDKPMIKRVIAVAGQELNIDFDRNEIYVDGKKLDEPYIQGVTVRGDIPDDEINGVIPEGKVFVLGDSRTVSLDSRHKEVGLIDVTDIEGVAAERGY